MIPNENDRKEEKKQQQQNVVRSWHSHRQIKINVFFFGKNSHTSKMKLIAFFFFIHSFNSQTLFRCLCIRSHSNSQTNTMEKRNRW